MYTFVPFSPDLDLSLTWCGFYLLSFKGLSTSHVFLVSLCWLLHSRGKREAGSWEISLKKKTDEDVIVKLFL